MARHHRMSRLSRPTWIWSTCLATPSGPASAKPSAHTSRKPQPGLSGNTKPTLSPPSPREPPPPPTGEPSRVTCLALSRVRWCWGKRALRTLGSSSPIPPRTMASAMKGSSMMVFVRPFQFDPFPRALDGALATLVPPRVALPTATSRAPRACFALPTASTSFRAGTRRTYMTLLTSSPQKQAPRLWGQPSALASTSMTRCALRLAALIPPPPRWSSPDNALMSPSSCITCA